MLYRLSVLVWSKVTVSSHARAFFRSLVTLIVLSLAVRLLSNRGVTRPRQFLTFVLCQLACVSFFGFMGGLPRFTIE
ncbi:hypothetical protein BGW80DRAFT_908431 [Lactifluus volemus]|nr:hypothetical protein BGW80DRAFT_908431 [Lactifluus volemus]